MSHKVPQSQPLNKNAAGPRQCILTCAVLLKCLK